MAFLRWCLLFAIVICSLQQFVASQYLIDEVLQRGVTDVRLKILSRSVYQFTTDLYEEILQSDEDANVFFSPISIYVALAMIYEGSEGETKAQLESAIRPLEFYTDDDFRETIKSLLDRLSSTNRNYTLKMVNRLFSQIEMRVNDAYQTLLTDYFDAGVEWLDFKTEPSKSRSVINSLVESETLDKIKNLFPTNAITNKTTLALANAVYFNCFWLYKFHEEATESGTFTAPREQELKVPMMHRTQEGLFYASKDQSYRLLELPYADQNVSMIIVLEDKANGFKELLKEKLDSYNASVHVFRDSSIELSLPKFNLQQTMNLKRILQTFGLKNLFENADLSGIGGSTPLLLTDAFHKSFLAVDESGSEAARATGFEAAMSESDCDEEEENLDFIVDRPFVFLVVEKATGSILFFGHIKNPMNSN